MIERWKLSGKQIPYVQQKMLAQIKSWWLYTHLVNAKSCGNIKPPGRQCCKTHQVRARSVISVPAKTFNIHPKFKTTHNVDKLMIKFTFLVSRNDWLKNYLCIIMFWLSITFSAMHLLYEAKLKYIYKHTLPSMNKTWKCVFWGFLNFLIAWNHALIWSKFQISQHQIMTNEKIHDNIRLPVSQVYFYKNVCIKKKGQLYIQLSIPLFIIKSKSQMTTVKLI